jgi:hypothetical protein
LANGAGFFGRETVGGRRLGMSSKDAPPTEEAQARSSTASVRRAWKKGSIPLSKTVETGKMTPEEECRWLFFSF